MTNTIAVWVGALILIFIAGDLILNGGAAVHFLILRVFALMRLISFWR